MKIKVAWIGKTKEPAIQSLTDEYLKRISHYAEIEGIAAKNEAAIVDLARGESLTRSGKDRPKEHSKSPSKGKDRCKLILLDSRGKQLSSEELAEMLDREQLNPIPLLFAIGGADGLSDQARQQAGFTLSLGRMTLPHELARVVLLEQIYRSFTILKNHPYHRGH